MGLKGVSKRFTPEARRLIRRLPPEIKKPMRALTDALAKDPLIGKPLRDKLQGFRSAPHTHYRIIYEYDEKGGQVTIHFVGPRKNIYELFEQLLKKGP